MSRFSEWMCEKAEDEARTGFKVGDRVRTIVGGGRVYGVGETGDCDVALDCGGFVWGALPEQLQPEDPEVAYDVVNPLMAMSEEEALEAGKRLTVAARRTVERDLQEAAASVRQPLAHDRNGKPVYEGDRVLCECGCGETYAVRSFLEGRMRVDIDDAPALAAIAIASGLSSLLSWPSLEDRYAKFREVVSNVLGELAPKATVVTDITPELFIADVRFGDFLLEGRHVYRRKPDDPVELGEDFWGWVQRRLTRIGARVLGRKP